MRSKLLITFFLLLLTVTCYGRTLKTSHTFDTMYVHGKFINDTLLLKSVQADQTNKSDSFDLKIWVPVFTALIVLLVTNFVTLYKIQKDTKESIKKEIIISKIKIERERLEKFYDPIYTTLRSNSSMFIAYGPNSFPNDNGVLETEASDVWKQIVQNVILPNNKKICEVIRQYSHLIHSGDSLQNYLDYIIHAESFEHFVRFPNTLHKGFKFPVNFVASVEAIRNDVLSNLRQTENKLTF